MATKDGPQAVIEVWQNLGSGQDIDDPVWRAVELGYPVLEISESKHIRARYESNTLALNLIEGDRSESPPVQKDSVTHRVLHWLIYVIEGTI